MVIIVAIILRSRAGVAFAGKGADRSRRLDYQPVARPVTPIIRPLAQGKTPSHARPPVPAAVSVVDGRTDIGDSTRALAEKYSLAGFTLATTDGLVFSTSGNPQATEDAAHYGGKSTPDGQGSEGVTLFTLTHRGICLTGIVRSERRPSHDVIRRIGTDTQEILNRWI
ncbi:MAG TPA: hypothetical protein VHN82_03280 [Methanoregula sp.]|nr:hypothetical protein [Methanoregula sp.]